MNALIIGIGGISRAGKSSLSNNLLSHFGDRKVAILHQDDYIKAGYNIPPIKDQIDWEDPESIDFHSLLYDLHWFANTVDILILEGLFAFFDEKINRYFDKRILIEIDFETFMERKKVDDRWGKIPSWYIHHIWSNYFKYGLPPSRNECLILSGEEELPMQKILDYINISSATLKV